MKWAKNIVKAWFSLTRAERNGTLVLAALLLLLLTVRFSLSYLRSQPATDFEAAVREAQELQANAAPVNAFPLDSTVHPEEPVYFDPNNATPDQLIQVGMSSRCIQNLLHYREKGGKFRAVEDLRKLYGLSEGEFNRLKPLVVIVQHQELKKGEEKNPDKSVNEHIGKIEKYKSENKLLELNSADSSALEGLPGIGPVLASRIIKYRQLLGGFYSPAQLGEVFGMPPETSAKLADLTSCDSTVLRIIKLSSLKTEKELQHPYITRWQATNIFKYQVHKKILKDLQELVDYKILSPEELKRLRPYLLP